MKGMKTILVLILIFAFMVISAGIASAAVNVYVNATMPYDVLYQGDITSANITVKNNENFPVRIYSIGVHYDWMPTNVFSSVDFGGNYVQVESNGVTSPGQLLIQCDNNVTTGYHSFYYNVNLNWYNSYTAVWVNETVVQPGTIFVESPLKPQALQELQFANKTLSDAKNANYQSKRAIGDVNNATDSMNDGWSAYNSNDYHRALDDSNNVINNISDAKIWEKDYLDNRSAVEVTVSSVNDKLNSLRGTTDPDTIKSINDANGYLNQTMQYINAEDFVSAQQYAHMADNAADKAINLQFLSSLRANQTANSRELAQSAMNDAQNNLNNASNMTSAAAIGILSDARYKLADAIDFFNKGDFDNATSSANVASTLVSQANGEEASYRMMLAHSKIASLGDLKSPDAKDLMAQANYEYNLSGNDYISSDFKGSMAHADNAYKLANDSAAAEQKWHDSNPLSAVTPGFGAIAALLALAAIFILKERKG